MRRHIHRIVIAVLAVVLLTLPAAAGPAHVDTPGDAGWNHGVISWFAGVLGSLQDVLAWSLSRSAEEPDLQRVTGEGDVNSHPTMDPNGIRLTEPDDGTADSPQISTPEL